MPPCSMTSPVADDVDRSGHLIDERLRKVSRERHRAYLVGGVAARAVSRCRRSNRERHAPRQLWCLRPFLQRSSAQRGAPAYRVTGARVCWWSTPWPRHTTVTHIDVK